MKIKALRLINFRRFKDFSLDFDSKITVIVAKNGAGKSSILDAVAILLGSFLTRLPKVKGISPKETDFHVHPNQSKPAYMRISCETTSGVAWDRTEKRDQSNKTSKLIPAAKGLKQLHAYVDSFLDAENASEQYELPVFVYYGTGRGVFDVPQRKRGFRKTFSRFDAFDGALEGRANFKRFVEYFYYLEDKESGKQKEERSFDIEIPELKAIRQALTTMLPDFKNPRSIRPAGLMVDWHTEGQVKQLKIEQFSDGFRTTLAMVMDIAARMAEANPGKENPIETEGVILIDEVDLHLHPGWQQRILLDLSRTFPNVQFIVTTHSPQVVSTVEPDTLRVIDWIDDEPHLIPVDFSLGAEAQQILAEVLDVEARATTLGIVQKLKAYQGMVEANQWDSEEAKKLRQELEIWGGEYEPELLRLDMDIRMKSLDLNE